MLFPVFDMLSVFPLVGITLGNNLYSTAPESLKVRFTERKGKIMCILFGTIPPVIMAAILGELNKIFAFTGLFAFFLEVSLTLCNY